MSPADLPDGESEVSDNVLAQLELALERGEIPLVPGVDPAEAATHAGRYSLIESLTSPLRAAIRECHVPSLDEYSDLEEIGRGGMGVVYRGLHRQTGRVDAIKVIRRDRLMSGIGGNSRDSSHRLRREAQLAARVAHEYIVPVYQVGECQHQTWYSMQLVDGKNLNELTRESRPTSDEAATVMTQISRAIDCVHRHGILHGDIKPHNILIEQQSGRPLITDFGLAEIIGAEEISNGVAGTPAYMAPELANAAIQQKSPEEIAGIRSVSTDIYSLGATLGFLLTGRPPYREGQTAREQLEMAASGRSVFNEETTREIPRVLMEICRRCLSPNPADRYTTAGQLADELNGWLNRPRWNRYFPGFRSLLLWVVAPSLAISGVVLWWLLRTGVAEPWIWTVVFLGYVPLFLTFQLSQRSTRSADPAIRELWSVWIGHLVGTLACLISLRTLCEADMARTMTLFMPMWGALTSVVFFAKSGNFWRVYRWIGGLWALNAVAMSFLPELSPVMFGFAATVTCFAIALGDYERMS